MRKVSVRLPRWLSSKESACQKKKKKKESACQCRRRGFNPWVGKIPWRRKWQPTRFLAWEIPWTEEPGSMRSQSQTRLEQLNTQNCYCSKSLQLCPTCNPMDPARLLCPRDFPGKNTGVGCHFLPQGIFVTRDKNLISYVSYIGR